MPDRVAETQKDMDIFKMRALVPCALQRLMLGEAALEDTYAFGEVSFVAFGRRRKRAGR